MRAAVSLLAILGPLLLMVGGCGLADEDAIDVVLIGSPEGEAIVETDAASRLLAAATYPAFVTMDEEARIAPGIAESWIVTDDGLSYIFRLRPDPDTGAPVVSADAARKALLARIAALRETPLGDDLAVIDDVIARTGRVVEIQLAQPMPDFLQLFAQPELALSTLDPALAPMQRTGEDDRIVMTGQGREVGLRYAITDSKTAVDLFQSDRARILLGGGIEALPYVELSGLLRGTIRLDPVAGLFGLLVVADEGLLADPQRREAISMAIDRDNLISAFAIGGWVPARQIVPPDMSRLGPDRREGWHELSIEERRALGSARIAAWNQETDEAPILSIALPGGEGGNRLFEKLRADLAKVGVGLVRAAQDSKPDLVLLDRVASHRRPEWYLNRLTCKAEPRGCDKETDLLLASIRKAETAEERDALLAEVEARFVESQRYIPFGPPIRFSLVRGGIEGFAVNPIGIHPLPPLALSMD